MKNKIEYNIEEIIKNPFLLLNKFTFCKKLYHDDCITNLIYFYNIQNQTVFCYIEKKDEYYYTKKKKHIFYTSFLANDDSDIDDFFRVYCTSDYPIITLF